MRDKQVLIRLANVEQYTDSEIFPDITHARIVNVKFEVARPFNNKEGFVDVWIAKGYLKNGIFYEAPGYPGVNIVIENEELILMMTQTVLGSSLALEVFKILSQYLLDTDKLEGVLEIIEAEQE